MRFWRKRRRRDHDESGSEGVVVLGQQMADAIEREERHRAVTGAAASPLAGIAYEPRRGELDLHRFVESPADTAVTEFAASYKRLSAEEAGEVRAALSMDDFYTLLTFVRRSVLASLQSCSSPSLRHGLAALSAIDQERVDWRDVAVAAELLAWRSRELAATTRQSSRTRRGIASAVWQTR